MSNVSTLDESSPAADEMALEIDLRDSRWAALLGWLIPGAGHLYQGRFAKGILFFVCIMGTWFFGMYLGQGRVVYMSTPPDEWRWAFFCQLGVGLPALPAAVQWYHARRAPQADPLWGGMMAPPRRDERELHQWQLELHRYFELGTVYTMIAGLLNVLAIYDAHSGPLLFGHAEQEKRREDDDEQEKPQENSPSGDAR